MKSKKAILFFVAIVMVISIFGISPAAAFSDVGDNHPYKDAIDFCKENGLIMGVGGDKFLPDASITRGQLAVIWCRVLLISDANHSFTDITKLNKYYEGAALTLNSLGMLKGSSTDKFSPGGYFTREQLAVLTTRTFDFEPADPEAYTQYTDHASVSDWARDGISSCINAKVFRGLYDGQTFEPKKPVTRAELSKLIYNITSPEYTITIGTITGGTITANKAKAHQGETVTLTVTPDSGKQLQAGSLKYNDTAISGYTFIMPAQNVTITGIFENTPVLESISVTSPPTKVTYTVGETLDLTGMTVTAMYSSGPNALVTTYTTDPIAGSVLDTEGTKTVTVSYTEDAVTKTVTFEVQVNPVA